VLDQMAPETRLAILLHDTLAVPVEDLASITGRTSNAARPLARRACRRVQTPCSAPDTERAPQQPPADVPGGLGQRGFNAFVELLAPGTVIRADRGALELGASRQVRAGRP
jgi:RNA polymerase sigma-70 factor (ECF subfamily)